MHFQGRLIQVTATRAVQVAWASDIPQTLVNRDASTPVILGADDGMQATGNAIAILDPQAALSVDGSLDIWAITTTGTATVNNLPGTTGIEKTH